MEQLIVTPIRPAELILGKAIPFIGLGYINITLVLLAGTYWFDVAKNRAVAVDTAAIREALTKVYRAGPLATELGLTR